jgi:hypothetical protein
MILQKSLNLHYLQCFGNRSRPYKLQISPVISRGPVGSHISNKTSFDSRNYGYKNLSSLFRAIDLFEIKRGPGNSYLVRDIRKKK